MKCTHCLKPLGKQTRDHVFPKSWYPDNTPQQIQRPVVPCCKECNNSLGVLEQELFYRLAGCVDPDKAEASGINKRLLRSFAIGNEEELSPKEISIRRKMLAKILKELRPYKSGTKTFPGFGLHKGHPPEKQRMLNIPAKQLVEVSKKIIRGLEYLHGNDRYIEPPYEVEAHFVEEGPGMEAVYSIFSKYGSKTDYGPGFEVERAAATDGTRSIIYRIKIWNTLTIYGSIMTPDPISIIS